MTKEDAIATYWNSCRAVQELMLAQAQAHAQSRLQMSAAMEQRVSAAATLLLAASAVAAQIAWQLKEGFVVGVAAIGAVCFAVGGAIALRGVRAGWISMPGAEPRWWAESQEQVAAFTGPEAECWVIAHYFDTIATLREAGERRARALNLGLTYGAVGSCLLAFVAVLAIFR